MAPRGSVGRPKFEFDSFDKFNRVLDEFNSFDEVSVLMNYRFRLIQSSIG